MRIAVDTHTHSVASGHAYSTIAELAEAASHRGLDGFVLTDHGPDMPGGTHPWHFGNLRIMPHIVRGVRFFKGVESNIIDEAGRIDLPERELARLDFVLAGFHDICFEPLSLERNTEALVAALSNPWVDAISHPGNPSFPVDLAEVAQAAKEQGKALEINNSSFTIREGSADNCLTLARLCAQIGTRVVVGSDAHYAGDVGSFDRALAVIAAAGLPEELVVNADFGRFKAFLAERAAGRGEHVRAALG